MSRAERCKVSNISIIKEYDSKEFYIGNADWQKNILFFLFAYISALNYTAYWHDILYKYILWLERFIIAQILLKILLDLVFLIMGIARSLRNLEIVGVLLCPLLYLVLLFDTPRYITNMILTKLKNK